MIGTCCLCNRRRKIAWHLTNYFGIGTRANGQTCAQCFEAVRHGGNRQPVRPPAYRSALRRWEARQVAESTNCQRTSAMKGT
jgi:hypothetical protein